MCSKKITISPGEKISEIMTAKNNMGCYGLWSILSHKVQCLEVYEKKVIEILTNDPITFDLLIGIMKVFQTSAEKNDSYDIIEFKEAFHRDNFIAALTHSKQMATAAGSNYLIVLNPQPAKKKVQVIYWDLRKFNLF